MKTIDVFDCKFCVDAIRYQLTMRITVYGAVRVLLVLVNDYYWSDVLHITFPNPTPNHCINASPWLSSTSDISKETADYQNLRFFRANETFERSKSIVGNVLFTDVVKSKVAQ